jgi:hypothetical protein
VPQYVAVDEKNCESLRFRYRAAVEACRGLLGRNDDQLTDDDIKALEELEQARRDLLAALWPYARDVH